MLIHGGAGGVGSFAVQFARAAGARVTAIASGDGVEIVRQLGADLVIDHRTEDFTRALSDVDAVLDTIGGETQQRSFGVLRSGGLLLSTVSPPDEAFGTPHKVRSAFVIHQSDADRLSKVVDAVDSGTRLLVDRILALTELPDAFARQASGRARRKIILLP